MKSPQRQSSRFVQMAVGVIVLFVLGGIILSIRQLNSHPTYVGGGRIKLSMSEAVSAYNVDPVNFTILENWRVREENPELIAKYEGGKCLSEAQKTSYDAIVSSIQLLVDMDTRLADATFEKLSVTFSTMKDVAASVRVDVCPYPTLVTGIAMALAGDVDGAVAALDVFKEGSFAPGLLWFGITNELKNALSSMPAGTTAGESIKAAYVAACRLDSGLCMHYFGLHSEVAIAAPNRLFMFGFREPIPQRRYMATNCVVPLLGALEFGRWFGSFPSLEQTAAAAWKNKWYAFVPHLLDPFSLSVVRSCYRGLMTSSVLKFRDPQAARYVSYNDPLARLLQASHTRLIRRITVHDVKPTYTYLGGYVGAAHTDLKPHTDRPQCEFTCSLSIDVNPVSEVCPLALSPRVIARPREHPGGSEAPVDAHLQTFVYPSAGDGLVFKGRQLTHWRETIPKHVNCSNVFLHYVHDSFSGSLD